MRSFHDRLVDVEKALNQAAAQAAAHPKGLDPWQQTPAPVRAPPGYSGGGGPGGGGGGGDGPGGGGPPGAAAATFDAKKNYDYDKLFDDKVASSKAFGYSGGQGAEGEKRRKVIRGYFVQKSPDLLPVLNWVESLDHEEVTSEAIHQKKRDLEWMTELNVFELSRVI